MKLLTSIFACCFLFLRNALVLFLLSLSTTLFAQDANWKRYASGNTRAVTALVTEGNNVWAGMNHNLHHFDGTTWIEYNKTNSPMGIYPINCIAVSKKGDKYIGTAGGGVFKLSRDGSWSNINVTRARELPILCYQPTNLLVTTNDVIGLTVNNNNELVIIHSLSIYGIVQKEFVHISTYVDGRFMQSSVQRLSYSGNSFSADRVSLAFINDTLLMRDGYAMVQYTNNNLCRSSGSGYRRGLSNSPFDIYKGKIIYSDWNSIYILPTSYNDNTIAESYPYPREANCEVFYKNDFAVGDTAGLSIKNGFTWATYNTSNSAIPSNNVTQLARDSSGHLWLGTDNGIAKWDGTTMTAYFTNQIQNNFYFPAMSSPSFMVMDNAGDLWLTKYFNNNAKLHLDLCSSSWVGTGTPMWHSTGIVKGNNGNIWICSNGLQGPIKEFNGSNWTTHLNKNFTCIAKAPNGDIWAGSERHPDDINSDGIGLFRYNGSTWVTYNSSNSNIRTTNIYDMVFASTGKAWLSTEGGIATFDGTNWILYSLAGGRRNQALVDNSDNYWFAKTNMLKKFNGTTLTDYPVPSGNIACIAKDNNDIWVGTDNYKLYKFSIATNTWQQINIGLAGTGAISTIYIDPQGTKWLSNNEYLLQYHENGIQKGGLSITSSNLSLFLPCGTNANSGSVTVQALHGTLPYTYAWSNGASTPSLSGVSAGLYKVTVTDNAGCRVVQQFPIKQSNQLITEISKGGDNLCKGDRSAYVNMLVDTSSGILPFRYLWRNTTNDSIGVSRTRYNLPKGSYKCTVTSSNGCTGVDSIVINEPLLPISTQVISTVNPTTLQVNPVGHIDSSSPLVVTYDLSGQLTAFRYKGCTMRWENGSIDFKYVNPPLGTLRYTLTNHKGCSKLDSIQICSSTSSAILFNVSSNFLKASANRMADTIKINVNGGAAPYRYFWSTGGTDSVQSAIARGIYNYTVTDRNGCTSSGAHIDTVVDSVDVKFRVSFKGSGKRVHPSGVRVTGGLGATTQPDWNPAAAKVMVLEAPTSDSVYSVNIKVPRRAPNEIYEFKYVNGNDWGTGANGTPEDERSVPAPCRRDLNDNRFFTLIPFPATSMILPCYKFNTCTVFPTVGTADFVFVKHLTIAPNPMSSNMHVFFTNDNKELYALEIVNSMGQVVRSYPFTMDSDFTVERGALATGLYLARLRNPLGQFLNAKFMIE